jgi:hypothetical protein
MIPTQAPPPPFELLEPEHEWRVYAADEWRTLGPDTTKRCRNWRGHRKTRGRALAVAELRRKQWAPYSRGGGGRSVPVWWAYCAEHLYGRWLEGGVVLEYRVADRTAPEGADFVRRWAP